MKRSHSEHSLQCAIVKYCDLRHWPIFHIANGGARNVITGAMLRRAGVKRGVPDLFLPTARRGKNGFFIECKSPTGHVSPWQQEWIVLLNDAGYLVQVQWNLDEAIKQIEWYMGEPA